MRAWDQSIWSDCILPSCLVCHSFVRTLAEPSSIPARTMVRPSRAAAVKNGRSRCLGTSEYARQEQAVPRSATEAPWTGSVAPCRVGGQGRTPDGAGPTEARNGLEAHAVVEQRRASGTTTQAHFGKPSGQRQGRPRGGAVLALGRKVPLCREHHRRDPMKRLGGRKSEVIRRLAPEHCEAIAAERICRV